MKHIVVGGNGLVGRHLVDALMQRGEEVVIADIARSPFAIDRDVAFVLVDIADPAAVTRIPIAADDAVYNLAGRMPDKALRPGRRHDCYWQVNYYGTFHILEAMMMAGATRLVQFSSGLVYGRSGSSAVTEDSPSDPLGEYAASKAAAEGLADTYRALGMRITIFRPSPAAGPERHPYRRLFKYIEHGLPVPFFGDRSRPYQLVSAFDCASAAIDAWQSGFPNEIYNLGSDNPPAAHDILLRLIEEAGGRSRLLPIPAAAAKAGLAFFDRMGLPIREPDRYLIADRPPLLATAKAKRQLGWYPTATDIDLALAAYREYRSSFAEPITDEAVLPAE